MFEAVGARELGPLGRRRHVVPIDGWGVRRGRRSGLPLTRDPLPRLGEYQIPPARGEGIPATALGAHEGRPYSAFAVARAACRAAVLMWEPVRRYGIPRCCRDARGDVWADSARGPAAARPLLPRGVHELRRRHAGGADLGGCSGRLGGLAVGLLGRRAQRRRLWRPHRFAVLHARAARRGGDICARLAVAAGADHDIAGRFRRAGRGAHTQRHCAARRRRAADRLSPDAPASGGEGGTVLGGGCGSAGVHRSHAGLMEDHQ